MSRVTNVIFSFDPLEDHDERESEDVYYNMESINQWLVENAYGTFGKEVDRIAGGTKHLETPLFAAGFNYFNVDTFVTFVRLLEWQYKQAVQLFVKEDGDIKFRVVEPFNMD